MVGVQVQQGEHLVEHLAEGQLINLGEHPVEEDPVVLLEEQAQQEVCPVEMVMLLGEHLVAKEGTVCWEHLMVQEVAEVQPIG